MNGLPDNDNEVRDTSPRAHYKRVQYILLTISPDI
jgi:hypothetical protein